MILVLYKMTTVQVPVCSISSLLGENRHKTGQQALTEIHSIQKDHPMYDGLERMLRKQKFYKEFCEAKVVTQRLRVLARKYVDAA